MSNLYNTEREGQIAFFENFRIPWKENNEVLADNTDGVWNGNLMEFKLNINDLNKTLFQAVKYLSRMRIKGESIPANILLISLNDKKAYLFKSEDYRSEIQKIYIGAASKHNGGFSVKTNAIVYNYAEITDSSELKHILKDAKDIKQMYMPVDIDENCIVGWAERYYRENPKASKGDFIGDETGASVKITGEIREPKHFKYLIRPYTGKTNEKFKYLMDKLNDNLSKKDLGAYYTSPIYAACAAEFVRQAADNAIDAGKKDYIILDRCAGTGNLEAALVGIKDKNGDELISHCIVSTYEYYEYKVLNERLGDMVREILPPTEADVVYQGGKVLNANALSKEFIENPIVKKYIDNQDCGIIMFENPPYRDQSKKNNNEETKKQKHTDKSFVRAEMSKTKKYGLAVNDIVNLFVWSAYKYYLRQESDSYILFAPIKCWKRVGLLDKSFQDGYIFNRKYFHATAEAITCMYFKNIDDADTESITLHAADIKNGKVEIVKDVILHKSHQVMSQFFDKRKFDDDDKKAICCMRDGKEAFRSCRFKPSYNKNIIGYLRAESYGFDANSVCLVRNGLYNGNGCYLRKDKYLEILPLFCAKQYPFPEWYLKSMMDTTSDGGDAYTKDADFLKACLIYTCLSNQNKCLSFEGSDGRFYQNELCFDNTHTPVALQDLGTYTLDDDEKELLNIYSKILEQAKATKNYKPEYSYGTYQIFTELNTYTEVDTGKRKKRVYDYPELNGNLATLRAMLQKYYNSHIKAKMLEYQLVK